VWLDSLNEKFQKNPLFSLVILISTTLTFFATIIANITAIKSFIQNNIALSVILSIATILILLAIVSSTSYFKKREWLRKVEWLRPGANISVYLGKFGDPMIINHDEVKKRKEYVFINTYFYLVLITDMNDEVRCFTVTIKNKAFKPIFKSPGYPKNRPSYKIKLGASTFSEIPHQPDQIRSHQMAHYGHSYYETFYFGRPGYYLHFAFGINDAGYHPKDYTSWYTVFHASYDIGWHHILKDNPVTGPITNETLKKLQAFRSTAAFNTYAVSNDNISIRDIFGKNLGVSYEQVIKLEDR